MTFAGVAGILASLATIIGGGIWAWKWLSKRFTKTP
jgi:hypothetical protein